MTSIQAVTVFDPSTGALHQASGLRRADTVSRIRAFGGEADEFLAAVKADPERLAPWVSKSGNTVVVFNKRTDPRDEWEPAPRTAVQAGGGSGVNARRYRCAECGKESNAGGVALHLKSSGHAGSEPVPAEAVPASANVYVPEAMKA